ncbi:glycosyltransferase family 9 protein [Candidatus Methylopumilus universalis]|uniref:glycosyltransferase family 9 protein n=1 Tax=Candidatus Methylopumilus universalis TaxID=2588536 RepID=UPI003BEEC703
MKRDKLGDLLLTTPMLQLLKKLYPKSKLAVVAPESSAWILKNVPFIDQLYSYPQLKSFNLKSIASIFIQLLIFLKIRIEHYDIAIAAGGEYSPRAIKRLLWIKAKRTISFVPKNKPIKEITDPVIAPSDKNKGPHESQRMIKLLDPIIKSKKQINQPNIYFKPSEDWLTKAQLFLTNHQLKKEQYIVFGLGARREKKQASKEQIIETAIYAYKKHKLKTILVWTPGSKNNRNYPGDDEIAYDILKNAPKEIIPLRAPLGLTIGVIWFAKKSIFPDSGLMHFASASPGGVIGLFAETKVSPHPKQWGPLGLKSNYIEAKKSIKELGVSFLHEEINRL